MSKGEDGNASILSEGDVCGEELLTWCLEHSSVSKGINSNHACFVAHKTQALGFSYILNVTFYISLICHE